MPYSNLFLNQLFSTYFMAYCQGANIIKAHHQVFFCGFFLTIGKVQCAASWGTHLP